MTGSHNAAATTMLGTAAPPPHFAGIANITTGPDNLPPFYTGRGLYYPDNSVPQSPPASGVLNSNTTGRMFSRLDVQLVGGVASFYNVVLIDTVPHNQDYFTSLNVGGFQTALSAGASNFFQVDLGTGYWITQWELPLSPTFAFPAGTYNFTFT